MARAGWLVAPIALLFLPACSGDEVAAPPAASCPQERQIGGICAGVPAGALCDTDACTDRVSCSSTIQVASAGALDAALKTAAAGSCIALAPGSYGDAALPGGVSLLGKGADLVKVDHVLVGDGMGAVVRGLEVGSGGLQVGGQGTLVEAVRVSGSAKKGIEVASGATVTVKTSEITGAAAEGVFALDATSITLESSVVSGSGGPGVWAQCGSGCDCAAPAALALTHVIVHDAKQLGASLIGVSATLTDVEIRDTHPGADAQLPGGLAVAMCASLEATELAVLDNDPFDASYGILVDGSKASIGGADEAHGFDVRGNLIGVWVQNLASDGSQPVHLQHGRLAGNRGVGLGMSGETVGIIINWFVVKDTGLESLPTNDVGSENVGDGLVWQGGATAQIDQLTLSNNARASVLIDGEVGVGSSLDHVTLAGGDEVKGMLQQSFPMGGMSPTLGASAPPITQDTTKKFAVPAAPAAPTAK